MTYSVYSLSVDHMIIHTECKNIHRLVVKLLVVLAELVKTGLDSILVYLILW